MLHGCTTQVFKYTLEAGKPLISSIYQIFPPDKLHTFDKGPVEYVIRYTITVVKQWHRCFGAHFPRSATAEGTRSSNGSLKRRRVVAQDPIDILDQRIIHFPRANALSPIGDLTKWMHGGVSALFSQTKQSNCALATGAMSGGGFDAKALGQYVLQLIIAIGTAGKYMLRVLVSTTMEKNA